MADYEEYAGSGLVGVDPMIDWLLMLIVFVVMGCMVFTAIFLTLLPLLVWLAFNRRTFWTRQINLRSIFWLMFACGLTFASGGAMFRYCLIPFLMPPYL